MPRSTYYYQPRPESAENLRLLRQLDQLYLKRPFFGSRKMAVELEVNRKRIQRLMRILGIEAHYPKPNLSRPAPGHEVYPYLLRGVAIERPNHVWSTDITYIPMRGGFLYLVAVMDWFSRFVLSWELSNTMETGFCLAALEAAFRFGQPEIWNSDQGSQFTSADFLAPLKKRGISISMDGRGRALDNVFIERLWRSLKYELIYPGDFATGLDLFPRWKTTSTSTITSARTRRSAIGRRQICSRTTQKGKGHFPEGDSVPQTPWDLSLSLSRMDVLALLQTAPAVQSRGLIGRQGNAGMRPERRLKPGMDGGLTAAVLVSPPLHLRTPEICPSNGVHLTWGWAPASRRSTTSCCISSRDAPTTSIPTRTPAIPRMRASTPKASASPTTG